MERENNSKHWTLVIELWQLLPDDKSHEVKFIKNALTQQLLMLGASFRF